MDESTGMDAAAEGETVAACALSCVPGMGASALARVAQEFGSLEHAVDAGSGALVAASSQLRLTAVTMRFLEQGPDLKRLGDWAFATARAAGARVVLRSNPSYPDLLRRIANGPALLYVRGALAADAHRVAIVGARAADEVALRFARRIAEELAAAGVEIVSGGARGVDGAAHAGAVWGGGTTVAVLGTGIDVAYPPEHGPLFDRIALGGGALVSEFPPGTPSSRSNFPRRNRTIAGLSHATLVVRASTASGALITASCAIAQKRALFAIPGGPEDELAAGPNRLIELGAARPVRQASEILELLDWSVTEQPSGKLVEGRASKQWSPRAPEQLVLEPPLEGVSRDLWGALDDARPAHVDALAARARVSTPEALRWLTELELRGLCRQTAGKYFLRRRAWPLNPNGSAGI